MSSERKIHEPTDNKSETRQKNKQTDDETTSSSEPPTALSKQQERLDKLKQLRKQKMESAKANRKDTHQEYTNKHTDYSQVERQKRKKEEAELELSKIELEEKGEDFERKRAWDWTIEESENWDKKQQEKSERVKTSKFSDYTTAAERAYLKDLQDLQPDIKDYNEKKIESLKSKGMIIEGKDGEIIAYDMDGSLTTSQDSLSQFSHKPSKKVVDNLVNHLKKGSVDKFFFYY